MVRTVQVPVVRWRGRRRPNLSGDLGQLLSPAPVFRRRLAGYDPLQVDNYVVWAESELEVAGRELDELTARLGRCTAHLQQAEQHLATSPAGWQLGQLSERVGEILRLAADEAADLVAAGQAEADRLRTEGREAAAAAVQQAQRVRAQAVADCDRLHGAAEGARRAAEAEREGSRRQVTLLLRLVAAQHAAAAAEAEEAHRAAEQDREAAHAEHALARARRTQAEEVVDRLSAELTSALGELTPAPALLAVVPPEPGPDVGGEARADRRSAS